MKNVLEKAKKLMCCALICSVVFNSAASAASFETVAEEEGPNDVATVYDLIVLVVEKDLSANQAVRERFLRYADDLSDSNPYTDVRIITFDEEEESVQDLALALENFYRNGDGNHQNQMKGVVLVGDIPLPVVNLDGNRFVSMFPYTDFEDKVFEYDEVSGSFVESGSVGASRPEAWHGVIRGSAEEIIDYFDRNHDYYEGDLDFEEELFFADLVEEESNINEDVYANYLKYLESWEDLAYMRYTQEWAQELSGSVLDEIPINAANPDAAAFAAELENVDLGSAPDVQSKSIIDQYLLPYYRTLGSNVSRVNDLAANTGRYENSVKNMPVAISIKDAYSQQYLKQVNELLEEEVNEIVEEIEQKLPLVKSVELSGSVNGQEFARSQIYDGGGYFNYGLDGTVRLDFLYETGGQYFLNGVNAEVIEDPLSCSVFRGSEQFVRAIRSDSVMSVEARPSLGVSVKMIEHLNGTGALVEANPAAGLKAIWDSRLEGLIEEGDIIWSLNGRFFDPLYTFDRAVEDVWDEEVALFELEIYRDGDLIDVSVPRSGAVVLNNGYGATAGCDYSSTSLHSDRCFYPVSTYPVFDPAGAVEIEDDGNLPQRGVGEGELEVLPYAGGDIDSNLINSCYAGVPNQNVLGAMRSFGNGNPNASPSNATVWGNLHQFDASDVVLDESSGITLKDFTDAQGLESGNLAEIGRLMLSQNGSFEAGNGGAVLNVNVENYGKEISSMVVHDEPTEFTIFEQVKAGATESLPIDSPRYVAFLDSEGEMRKIVYPNLFQVENFAQLGVVLDQRAWQLTSASAPVECAAPADNFAFCSSLHQGILERLKAGISGATDQPESGFDLEVAAGSKVVEALNWKSADLEEKHLKLLSDVGRYEAAYLVLGDDGVQFEEVDLVEEQFVESGGELGLDYGEQIDFGDVGEEESGGAEGGADEDGKFVSLPEFLGEVLSFLEDLGEIAGPVSGGNAIDLAAEAGVEAPSDDFENLLSDNFAEAVSVSVKADSNFLVANGKAKTTLSVTPLDESGNTANDFAGISLFVQGDAFLDPGADLNPSIPGTQIYAFEGPVDVVLNTGDSAGEVKVFAVITDPALEDQFVNAGGDLGEVDLDGYNVVSKTFPVLQTVDLNVTASGGGENIRVSAQLEDGYNGPISFEVLTPTRGAFVNDLPEKMSNGRVSNLVFRPFSDQKVEILVNVPGFASEVLSFGREPDVEVSLDEEPAAEFGLENVRALYTSLLGSDHGNVLNGRSRAEELVISNNVQAVFAMTEREESFRKMLNVDGFGKVSNLSGLDSRVVLATDSFPYQRVIFGEVAEVLVVPDSENPVGIWSESAGDGVWLRSLDERYELIGDEGVDVLREGNIIASIDDFGRINIVDQRYELELKEEARDFVLALDDGGGDVVEFIFRGEQEVKIAEGDVVFPGVYLKLRDGSGRYNLRRSFSGVSSNAAKGLEVVDSSLMASASIGMGEEFGFGYQGENKHMLLFASGNSVGESHLLGASVAGIVFGDPNIKVDRSSDIGAAANGLSGFGDELGEVLYAGDIEPLDVIRFDYNGDNAEDILLVYEDGLMRLIENVHGAANFVDRGYLANVAGGIVSATRIDVNNDGFDDLIVGTEESCRPDDECLALFTNDGGHFDRSSLNLAIDGKAYSMEAGDLNADGCEDLVISDSAGSVRIFRNVVSDGQCDGLDLNPRHVENFGYSFDSGVNLSNNILISFGGAEQEVVITLDERRGFQSVNDKARFESSSKTVIDKNGGSVAVGDELEVIITIDNAGGAINDLFISDLTPTATQLEIGSLACLDSGCTDELRWENSGMGIRSAVIAGASVPANGQRTIRYNMKVTEVPEVSFDLGVFQDPGTGFLDIRVRPKGSGVGTLNRLFSQPVLDAEGFVEYNLVSTVTEQNSFDSANNDLLEAQAGLENAQIGENGQFVDQELLAILEAQIERASGGRFGDHDYDGCVDSWDTVDSSAENFEDAVANEIENFVSSFRCSGGGCIPSPYNYAFFAPDGATPGIATLALGVPFLPGFATFYPSTSPSSVRFYTSPTLTGGLGTAVCVGAPHSAPCFAYAPPIQSLVSCPNFLQDVNNAISAATNVNANPDAGMTTLVSDGILPNNSETINFGRTSPNDSPISSSTNVNAQIPGFPSVITNWFDNQTDEFFTKLLDLPDFYFIYPDIDTLAPETTVGSGVNFQSANGILDAINSLPLVQIEGREVLIKVPALSSAEIEKFRTQAENWVRFHEDQLEKIDEFWNCDFSNVRETLCDAVKVDLGNNIEAVKDLLDSLDELAQLPGRILEWRDLESKYASQIIAYLDAIMETNGGYLRSQQRIINSWIEAGEKIIRVIREWQVLFNVMIDYQQSCDHCKSDRFSELGVLLNFFVAIPEPPVIPFPKWPDVVFDISQVRMGTKIIWPDVVFKPEPVVLPELPVIVLPNVLAPEVDILEIEIEDLGIPELLVDFPNFVLPELPDLPPLPLLELPDIPRPPYIPSIPPEVANIAENVSTILRILCLLKTGLIPIPESALATEFETLTQPNIQAVLPFIKNLSFQAPAVEYDFLEQIRVDVKTDIGIETDFIYDRVDDGAEIWNEEIEELIEDTNEFIEFPLQELIERIENASAETSANFEELPEEYVLDVGVRYLAADDPILNRSIDEILVDDFGEYRDVPSMRRLMAMRDALIARVELPQEDYLSGRLASLELPTGSGGELQRLEVEGGLLGKEGEARLLALAEDLSGSFDLEIENVASSASQSNAAAPRGYYMIVNGENERILAYDQEIDASFVDEFIDVDGDSDSDLVYVMGANVYLKKNYEINSEENAQGSIEFGVFDNTAKDFVLESPINDIQVNNLNHSEVELVWHGLEADRYEVILRDSLLQSLDDGELLESVEPSITLELEEGNYYANVFAVSDGERSLISDTKVISLSVCSDEDAPMPVVLQSEIDVPLNGTAIVDARNSFDPSGEIVRYHMTPVPNDGSIIFGIEDGTSGTPLNLFDNPVFELGPFDSTEDIGQNTYILHVTDQSGKVGTQRIDVNVFVPQMSLDPSFSRSGVARVRTLPEVDNFPVELMRRRLVERTVNGEVVLEPKIELVRESFTDSAGEIEISDFVEEDFILIENGQGEVVARINPETGNVTDLEDGTEVFVVPANGESGMRIELRNNLGSLLATIMIVADSNSDAVVVESLDNAESNYTVAVTERSDDFAAVSTPGSAQFPGGVYLVSSAGGVIGVVDSSGNIYFFEEGFSINLKPNNFDIDPVIFEILFENRVIYEVYVPIYSDNRVIGENDVELVSAVVPQFDGDSNEALQSSIDGIFADASELDGDLKDAVTELFEKEIIEGRQENGELFLRTGEDVVRAEFAKILLSMVCIEPRPEAYEAGIAFNDIQFSESDLPWYYPIVKEASLRELIDGYGGEIDENGLSPFKPENTITRAEAVKIIVETLEHLEFVDLAGLESTPAIWYEPYLAAGLDLTPYMGEENLIKNNFIITEDEASRPNEEMTRADLIVMATRVLDIYDCFEDGVESEGEGEEGDDVDDETETEDGSGSDGDGDDGVVRGGGDSSGSEAGLYLIPGECNVCPCPATFVHSAEIRPGDVFFSALTVENENGEIEVLSKSNDVTISR